LESSLAVALILGLLLGARHSLDPDHVVAVSTMVSEYRNPFKALWIGVSWGLGHTTTLLIVGLIVVGLHVTIPENIALFLELIVGVMLIVLGLQVLWAFRKKKVHLHPHDHDSGQHYHFHSHAEVSDHAAHHKLSFLGKPSFRLKSYLVGTVHGVAGSAALMLIALTAIDSPWTGILYIVLFGLGSIVSMGIMTIFLAVPFSTSARFPAFNRLIQMAAGTFSIIFGFFLIYEIGIGEGLLLSGG
jgi:ABC-type nickel/cobalt efflux system permease component RcnA